MADLYEEFRAVVSALDAAGVPFAVCGGLALALHGRTRATIDIDLLAPPEAVARLAEALESLGYRRFREQPMRLAKGEIVMHRLTRIDPSDPDVLVLDVIEARPGVAGRAYEAREAASWEGRSLAVVSRDSLIAMKRLRGSAQDLADIAALESVRE